MSCDPHNGRLGFKTDGRRVAGFPEQGLRAPIPGRQSVLTQGQGGRLRALNSEARFRNVKVTRPTVRRANLCSATSAVQVNRQWDAFSTGSAVAAATRRGTRLTAPARLKRGNSSLRDPGANSASRQCRTEPLGHCRAQRGQTFEGASTCAGRAMWSWRCKCRRHERGICLAAYHPGIGAAWKKFPFELTAAAADRDAHFARYLDRPGRVRSRSGDADVHGRRPLPRPAAAGVTSGRRWSTRG